MIINFRTCLYVGAAVFIREFNGSLLLYDESQKLGSIGTEEKIYLNADKSLKTANLNFSKVKFVFINQQQQKTILNFLIHQAMAKKIGGRWWFSAVAAVSPPFLHSSTLFNVHTIYHTK